MRELVRTNNAVLITVIESLLKGAEIPHAVLDQHMSVLEGSLGMLPRRIVVGDDDHDAARLLLEQAGLAHELRLLPASAGASAASSADASDDAILGGRLRITQKKRGHRVGHDAVLLAAAAAVRPGDHVVELGAGVGAAGLALAVRVPDIDQTLVEIDAELAALAVGNAERNGFSERISVVCADVTDLSAPPSPALERGRADAVIMNPPFNDAVRQNSSPDPGREAAHVASVSTLSDWVGCADRLLHSAGALTMIWRADGLGDVLTALSPRFGGVAVMPVHGREGQPAIRILVQATKGAKSPLRLLPALILNDRAGKATAEGRSGDAPREAARLCGGLAQAQRLRADRASAIGRNHDREHQQQEQQRLHGQVSFSTSRYTTLTTTKGVVGFNASNKRYTG